MANRVALAAGGAAARMVDGNGHPVYAGGGSTQCASALEPGDVLVDGDGNPIGGGGGVPTSREIETTAPLTGGGDLTGNRTLGIAVFDDAAAGIVPASGGGTTDFLRADGTWAAPPGGSEAFPVGSVFLSVVATDPGTLLGYGTWAALAAGRMLVGLNAGDPDFDTVRETGGAKTHTLTTGEMPSHTHVQDAHTHVQNAHTHTQDAHGHTVTDPGHTHLTQRYPTATGASSGFTIDTSMSGALADNTLPVKSATTGLTVNNGTAVNQNATATNQNATAVNQNTGGGAAHNNLPPYFVVYMWERVS